MAASMRALLPKFLDQKQVERSSESMGVDTLLVDDGTYFLVYIDDALAGCGGWSRRRTLYGGNHTTGRDDALAKWAQQRPGARFTKLAAMNSSKTCHNQAMTGPSCRSSECAKFWSDA